MLLLAEDGRTNRMQLFVLPLLLDISFSFLWYPRTSAVPGIFRDVHTLAVPCPTYSIRAPAQIEASYLIIRSKHIHD